MDAKEIMELATEALLKEPRGLTFNQLKRLLGVHPSVLKSALALLCIEGHAYSTGDNNSKLSLKRYIHYTHAGAVTRSRSIAFPTELYTGTDWSRATIREGCLDHEKIGSRQGDKIVPYRGPRGIY
jgi:hypothetical protein